MSSLRLASLDRFIKASPVCKRAVVETVEALRAQGHECVEFKLPGPGNDTLVVEYVDLLTLVN